jgi:PHP family Zn ribbon phosphoesterase
MLAGISWGVYLYATRHTLSNAGNPVPMDKKVYGVNACPRCTGVRYVEAQGDGIGMKCPRCGGSGLR